MSNIAEAVRPSQLAKETLGIGSFERQLKRERNNPDRVGAKLRSGMFGLNQFIAPATTRLLEDLEHPLVKKYPWAMTVSFFVEMGIDATSLLLALNGNVEIGAAEKIIYNAGANVILTTIKSPTTSP